MAGGWEDAARRLGAWPFEGYDSAEPVGGVPVLVENVGDFRFAAEAGSLHHFIRP
jgi:hypothetical protein